MVHLTNQHNVYVLQDKLVLQVHHKDDTKQFNQKIKSISHLHTGPTQFTKTFVRAHISTNDCLFVIFAIIVSAFVLRFSIPIEY